MEENKQNVLVLVPRPENRMLEYYTYRSSWLAAKAIAERSEGTDGHALFDQREAMKGLNDILDDHNGVPQYERGW